MTHAVLASQARVVESLMTHKLVGLQAMDDPTTHAFVGSRNRVVDAPKTLMGADLKAWPVLDGRSSDSL